MLSQACRVSLAKKFFFSDRAQIFFVRVSSNFPTFFFLPGFAFFIFIIIIIIIIIIPPFTPRTNGDYLLRPRTRYKKSKDMPWKGTYSGPQNRPVSFA